MQFGSRKVRKAHMGDEMKMYYNHEVRFAQHSTHEHFITL